MTREESWRQIESRNPLKDCRAVTLSPDELRRLHDVAWDRGYRRRCEEAEVNARSGGVFEELFKVRRHGA